MACNRMKKKHNGGNLKTFKNAEKSTKFAVHATYDRGLVILWWRCDMLCTSGFVDDVMFSHNAAGNASCVSSVWLIKGATLECRWSVMWSLQMFSFWFCVNNHVDLSNTGLGWAVDWSRLSARSLGSFKLTTQQQRYRFVCIFARWNLLYLWRWFFTISAV